MVNGNTAAKNARRARTRTQAAAHRSAKGDRRTRAATLFRRAASLADKARTRSTSAAWLAGGQNRGMHPMVAKAERNLTTTAQRRNRLYDASRG